MYILKNVNTSFFKFDITRLYDYHILLKLSQHFYILILYSHLAVLLMNTVLKKNGELLCFNLYESNKTRHGVNRNIEALTNLYSNN